MNKIETVKAEGHESYPVNTNPYPGGSLLHIAWDQGYWEAHDESFEDNGAGIEDGYGDYYDYDAVSQGFYDDDPSPYSGTYSEM